MARGTRAQRGSSCHEGWRSCATLSTHCPPNALAACPAPPPHASPLPRSWVFQSFNLLATLSAFENVELPMAVLGKLTKDERTARAKHLLRLVGLEDRMSHLPSELSGGEQQRVAIARALANEPELLLLDEAVADLDTRNQVEVMNLLLHINREQRATMIMVSHHDDLETYADRVLYIADGVIASQALNAEQIPLVPDSYVEYLNQG